jgi:UDP-glucose 4-epimerase
MRIGITGGKGFIGSYLSQRLLARGYGPIRLLARSPGVLDPTPGLMPGDLMAPADCERFAAGIDAICYLAHVNSPVNSDLDPIGDSALNLGALQNLLQAVVRIGTKPHIIYFSSGGAVYQPKQEKIPYRESDACAPVSSYGRQKLAAENYLRLAADKGQISATILRVGNAYGTLLPQHRLQGLIGVALNSILHEKPVRVFGSLENVRDYVHLDDICGIVEKALTPREAFRVVNVGSGTGHAVREVLSIIEACYGKRIQIQVDPRWGNGLVDWVVLDVAKACQDFGWTPTVPLRSGIESMLLGYQRELQTSAATV